MQSPLEEWRRAPAPTLPLAGGSRSPSRSRRPLQRAFGATAQCLKDKGFEGQVYIYMCKCICIYVHIYMSMYIYKYTSIYLYLSISIDIDMYRRPSRRASCATAQCLKDRGFEAQVYIYVQMYMYICTYICLCIYTSIYLSIYLYL